MLTPEEQAMLNSALDEEFNNVSNSSQEAIVNNDSNVSTTTVEQIVQEIIQEEEKEEEILPTNYGSAETSVSILRFSSAEWFEELKKLDITICGIGGIGSWTALNIAKTNPRVLCLHDPDTVETVNLAGQLFSKHQTGEFKVYSMNSMLSSYADFYTTSIYRSRVNGSTPLAPITICGYDNMQARKETFYNWLKRVNTEYKNTQDRCLFVDGRLAAEEFQIFCFTGNDTYHINKYAKEWLFDDEEAEETVCSYKQTAFCASMIGSLITNLVVNHAANLVFGDCYRVLPFKTSYDATTMRLKYEDS